MFFGWRVYERLGFYSSFHISHNLALYTSCLIYVVNCFTYTLTANFQTSFIKYVVHFYLVLFGLCWPCAYKQKWPSSAFHSLPHHSELLKRATKVENKIACIGMLLCHEYKYATRSSSSCVLMAENAKSDKYHPSFPFPHHGCVITNLGQQSANLVECAEQSAWNMMAMNFVCQ